MASAWNPILAGMSTRVPRPLQRPLLGRRFMKRGRDLVLLALAAASLARCGHRAGPPAPPWTRSELPVGVGTDRASARADVAALDAAGDGLRWLAGGATVDDHGVRTVQIWTSATGPQGPWRRSSFRATSIDGPQDVIYSIAESPSISVAQGTRPSPLHGIPRPSMWMSTTLDAASWSEAPALREEFGGENVVSVGGVSAGPHGVALSGSWINRADRSSAAIWTSTNGLDWQRNDSDPAFAGVPPELPQASDIADARPGLVLVGRAPAPTPDDPTAEHGAIWWSADGSSWARTLTAQVASRDAQVSIDRVRFGGGRYVAVGSISRQQRVELGEWVSDDGRRWSQLPTGVSLPGGTISITGLAVLDNDLLVGVVSHRGAMLLVKHGAQRWAQIPLPAQAPPVPERLEVAATPQAVAIVVRATGMSGLWWAPLSAVG